MSQDLNSLLKLGASSRRHFLRASAIAGGLTAAGALTPAYVAGISLSKAAAQEGGDLGILNYALTLEHLEARLYKDLIASGLLSGQVLGYAQVYGSHEATHVDALTDTISKLGGEPVKAQEQYNFPKLKNQTEVVNTLVQVEDLGAAAYLGAAPLIKNGDLLTVAVQIHTVEAYHATGFRALAGQPVVPFAFAEGQSMEQVLKAVTPFLMAGMPNTGSGGGVAENMGKVEKLIGVAGVGAAAAAGVGLVKNRAGATERE